MSYSFIKPKLKPMVSVFSAFWLVFIGIVVAIMLIFNFFIMAKTSFMQRDIDSMLKTESSNNNKIRTAQLNISSILKEKGAVEEIYASNEILKDSMKNLFDLVPDQITLSRVIMQKDSLTLYGSTPSKDTYNFLLASPLRSIFNTSNTVFYLNEKGWYRFVSTNKIDNTDGFYE